MPVSSTTSRCKNPQTVLKNLSATVSFHHDTPNALFTSNTQEYSCSGNNTCCFP